MTEIFSRTFSSDHVTPVAAYAALRAKSPGMSSFLLESVVPGERWGRYSIIGYRPINESAIPAGHDAIRGFIESALPNEANDGAQNLAARFTRAAIGYIAYDTVNAQNKIKPWSDQSQPARIITRPTVAVFDNLLQTVTIAGESDNAVLRCAWEMTHGPELFPIKPPDPTAAPVEMTPTMTDDAYGAKVVRAKEYIKAGDVFQVVVARSFRGPLRDADPFDVYRALRLLSPSPYLYFFDFATNPIGQGFQVIGASPETLLRVDGRKMTLRPIAGTKKRGANEEEDRKLVEQLLADPKERAEHVMLIDLARNDVGRVCVAGTVELTANMQVEKYSHVMHIVSEVTGTVNEGVTLTDVTKAAFPAGTLSGAPKVRAMQIIRELEPRSRFVYGGAIGYAMQDTVDFAIGIRTVLCTHGNYEVTAGAGIVDESVPESEAAETRSKAQAALAAVRAAQDAKVERDAVLKAREAKRLEREAAAKAEAEAQAGGGEKPKDP